MRPLFLFFNLLILSSMPVLGNADNLKPFASDGCSAFPDGTPEQRSLWLMCCQRHDFEYWRGGTYSERLESDRSLKRCVSTVGEPEIALLMLAGVRVGGLRFCRRHSGGGMDGRIQDSMVLWITTNALMFLCPGVKQTHLPNSDLLMRSGSEWNALRCKNPCNHS